MSDFKIGGLDIHFVEATGIMTFQGVMRLPSFKDYDDVRNFMMNCTTQLPAEGKLYMDLVGLEFLNSSGITMFSVFVLALKKQGAPKLHIKGSSSVVWQKKSIANFSKLWDGVDSEIV